MRTLLVGLFIGFACNVWAKKFNAPHHSASDAIQLAQNYVKQNNIEISDRSFITEVKYHSMRNEYQPAYWSVNWFISPGHKGSWLEVRVYNDGKLESRFGK